MWMTHIMSQQYMGVLKGQLMFDKKCRLIPELLSLLSKYISGAGQIHTRVPIHAHP